MSHIPAPCPICHEPGGFHVGHSFEIPTDWRVVATFEWRQGTRYIYDDPDGREHDVVIYR